ncbi:MAG: hypothetical protein JO250_03025 [Armatimonadetes bacterium]|nr:hypothetical protein [Armatimonadota bacterium]
MNGDDMDNGGYAARRTPGLKDGERLGEHSLPFIYDAAGLGIELIEAQPDDPMTLPRLRQILADIQAEVVEEEAAEADSERARDRILRRAGELPCYECRQKYQPGTEAYNDCMRNCTL